MNRKLRTALGILMLVLVLCTLTRIALYLSRPYSDSVTISGLEQGASDGALVKVGDDYYETQTSEDFAKLFQFDKWEQTRKQSTTDSVIKLRFAEEWIVVIHSDGTVSAYDGYASSKRKSSAHYIAPVGIIDSISSYVIENGSIQEGRFLESAFIH